MPTNSAERAPLQPENYHLDGFPSPLLDFHPFRTVHWQKTICHDQHAAYLRLAARKG